MRHLIAVGTLALYWAACPASALPRTSRRPAGRWLINYTLSGCDVLCAPGQERQALPWSFPLPPPQSPVYDFGVASGRGSVSAKASGRIVVHAQWRSEDGGPPTSPAPPATVFEMTSAVSFHAQGDSVSGACSNGLGNPMVRRPWAMAPRDGIEGVSRGTTHRHLDTHTGDVRWVIPLSVDARATGRNHGEAGFMWSLQAAACAPPNPQFPGPTPGIPVPVPVPVPRDAAIPANAPDTGRWQRDEWTSDDRSYRAAREEVARRIKAGERPEGLLLSLAHEADRHRLDAVHLMKRMCVCAMVSEDEKRGEYAEAAADIRRSATRFSHTGSFEFARMRFLLEVNDGDRRDLLLVAQRLYQRCPKDPEVVRALVRTLLGQNADRTDRAVKLAQSLTWANPKDAREYMILGDARHCRHVRTRDPRQAVLAKAAYRRAISLMGPGDRRRPLVSRLIAVVRRDEFAMARNSRDPRLARATHPSRLPNRRKVAQAGRRPTVTRADR